MNKTVLITGTSSGFGRLAVKKFHQEGWNVVATMTTPEKETELNQIENVLVNRLDVTDKNTIEKSIQEGIEHFGKIDVLVNNAGMTVQGHVEDATDAQIRKPMEVNFFGTVNVIKAILPHFRENKGGIIINCSSLAGRVSLPYTSLYHASKFALEGFTASLQYELNPFGIKLKLVEPGGYSTNLTTSPDLWVSVPEGSAYKSGVEKAKAAIMNMGNSSGQDPQEVADTYYEAATDGSDTVRYVVGNDAQQILGARAGMNDVEFKNMIIQSMGL